MPRRTLIIAATLTLLLGALALLPQVRAVRDGILGYALRALEQQGVEVSYLRSTGNLWRNVTLDGVSLSGRGSDVTLDRLRLDYFLPALLGGELPLDVEVEGAAGDIDLAGLTGGPAAPGAGGGPLPRVRLGRLRLAEVALTVARVPFTLPDGTFSGLSVSNEDGHLRAAGELRTSDGAARFSATLDPATLEFHATVENADVALARHWWTGALAGSVAGTVSVVRGQVSGDFEVSAGSVVGVGLEADSVSGTVTLRYPTITAELTGRALGGPVAAQGRVDVAARRFSATGHAEPALQSLLQALAGPAGEPVVALLDLGGAAAVDLDVGGWSTVGIRGAFTSKGTVNGVPLEALSGRFSLGPEGELHVEAGAELGGGPAKVTIAPSRLGAPRLEVQAEQVDLAGLVVAQTPLSGAITQLTATLDLGRQTSGRLQAGWSGQLAGGPALLDLDGRLDADGVQAFVTGSLDALAASPGGARLTGAAVLAGGRLEGGLRLDGVALPGTAGAATVSLRAAGPPAHLPLSLDVSSPAPLGVDLSPLGLTVQADLRGSATADLVEGVLGPIRGTFGPLSVEAALTEQGMNAYWSLEGVPMTAPGAAATLGPASGTVRLTPAALGVSATARVADLSLGPLEVATQDLTGSLDLPIGAGRAQAWTAAVTGERVSVQVSGGGAVTAGLTDLPVRLAGSTEWADLSGTLAPATGYPTPGAYDLTVHLAAGAPVAGLVLPAPFDLRGTLADGLSVLEADAALGQLPIEVAANLTGAAALHVAAAGLTFDLDAPQRTWTARGVADVGAIVDAIGMAGGDVVGSLTLDLAGADAETTGTATLAVSEPAVLTLALRAEGRAANVNLSGSAFGQEVTGGGAVDLRDLGAAHLTVDAGPFTGLTVDQAGLRGTGEFPGRDAGPVTVGPTAWAVRADWASAAGSLELGGRRLDVRRHAEGWSMTGELAMQAAYAGSTYDLRVAPGRADGQGATLLDLATFPVHGALTREGAATPTLTFQGTPARLSVSLDAASEELTAVFPPDLRPDWRLSASGTVDLLAGPAYRAELELKPGPSAADPTPVRMRLTGTGATADLAAEGAGLYLGTTADAEGRRFHLRATDAPLGSYLPPGVRGVLSGNLVYDAAGWNGSLSAALSGEVTGSVTLTGRGARLEATATASGPADSTLALSGTILPTPRFRGTATALDGGARLDFDLDGRLTGRLLTAPVPLAGYGEVPELTFELDLDPATGDAALRRPGDEGALLLTRGELSGAVQLPLTTAVGPATLTLAAAGRVEDPTVTAQVTGALEGSATADRHAGVSGDLRLPAAALLAALPDLGPVGGLRGAPIEAAFELSPTGDWTAAASTELDGVPSGARLSARLRGAGLRYAGELAADFGGDAVAVAAIDGEAAGLEARLDLGAVDWHALGAAFGVELTVTGEGLLTLGTMPLTASLSLDLTARSAGNTLRVHGTAPDDLRLELSGPLGDLDGALTWATDPGAEPRARLAGRLDGTPIDLLVLMREDGVVHASAVYGAATASAELSAGPGGAREEPPGRTLGFALDAPPASVLPYGVAARGSMALDGDGLRLTDLRATLTGLLAEGAPVHVAAAGPLSRKLDIGGKLTTPGLEDPVEFTLTESAFEARWRSLALTGAVDLSSLAVTGAATPPDLRALLALAPGLEAATRELELEVLATDLTWSRAAGFQGTLDASLAVPGSAEAAPMDRGSLPAALHGAGASLSARGERDLVIAVDASLPGATEAVAGHLTVRGDSLVDPKITGSLRLALPLESLVPPLQAAPTRLTAELDVTGTVLAPSLAGSADLAGAVTASGPVTYAAGELRSRLTGDHVDAAVTATLTGTAPGWSATASLTDLDVSPWAPYLEQPRLDVVTTADGTAVHFDELAFRTPASQVTGAGRLDIAARQARLALTTRLGLADLALTSVPLTGTLTGPVTVNVDDLSDLSATTVTAAFEARGVGVSSFEGSLNGELSLSGTVADPRVTANLQGAGGVHGGVSVSGRPLSGELALVSDLAMGQLVTDLRVRLQDGSASASGTARYQDAALVLTSGVGGEFLLTGAGRLLGWNASVDPDLSRLRLTGELASVDPRVTGHLSLVLGREGEGPWLQADVQAPSVFEVQLGDLHVTAAALGTPLVVTGEHLNGTYAPQGGGWTATVRGLDALGLAHVDATAKGTGGGGKLEGTATSPSLDLAFSAEAGAGGSVVTAIRGRVLGGDTLLTATRGPAGWSGTVRLAGAGLGGTLISANGVVQGTGALPQLVLRTHASGPVQLSGRATVSADGITLDQVVSGGPLTRPVRVQGRVLPQADLTVATLEDPTASEPSPGLATLSQVRLYDLPTAGLRAAGSARLELGPVRVLLSGQASNPRVEVHAAGMPQLRVTSGLNAPDLVSLLNSVLEEGVAFRGEGDVTGTATLLLRPEPALVLEGLALNVAGLDIVADGRLAPSSADVHGTLHLVTDLPLGGTTSGPSRYELPWTLGTTDGTWRLASDGQLGTIRGDYTPTATGASFVLDVDLELSEGRVLVRLGHERGQLEGTLAARGLRLAPPGLGPVSLDAEADVSAGSIAGTAVLDAEAGRLTLTGTWGLGGLLPPALIGDAPSGGRLEARLRTLELSRIPGVHERAPFLAGALTGVVQLRDSLVFGQLVSPEIAAGDATSPVELLLSGSLTSLDASLRLRGGNLNATLQGERLSGLVRLERFPAQFLAQAVVGPTDVSADVTGVLRFDLPLHDVGAGYLRLATEEVRLERAGVPTVGNVNLTYDRGELLVERTEFAGLGRWQAAGHLTPADLDFHLEAVDADFSPLLGLVPSLARLGVEAAGTFTFDVGGDAALPTAKLSSPGLEVAVAGSRYHVADGLMSLDGTDLSLTGTVRGVSPLSGDLEFSGGARLELVPLELSGVDVRFAGSLDLPGFGVVEGVAGAITTGASGELALEAAGRMGAGTVRLEGQAEPFRLAARGQGLTVAYPALLVASALVDLDLELTAETGGFVLVGGVNATEVIVDPAARTPAPETAEPRTEAGVGPNPAAALRFADVYIRAPQRVLLTTNLGSGEASLDLRVSGTAADPRLAGTASALRGNLRFSGRDFTLTRAVATFNPGQGVFPALDVAAYTEMEKSRVASGDGRISFVEPREGQTFTILLAFSGQMVPAPAQEGGFRLDVRPRLTSDARIEIQGEGPGAGIRHFTEPELMSLIALGRFELNGDLAGTGGLGQAALQGALDTAVDLLVVSEFANALRQALGLDVVEIRTSALSSLLEDQTQPFGVSLRLGGYLNPELFASYRIGTYDGTDEEYRVTNEVLLSYGLGPLDLDLKARVDFPGPGMPGGPRPEVGLSVAYSISPMLSVDAGVLMNTSRGAFQVGLTLRW